MPIKWGNFLDERLDEMYIGLRHCPFEIFKPLTPVEIHFSNELYFGSTTVDTQTKIKRYIVANDENAEESPVGGVSNGWYTGKLYNHNLYIIELTKYLECIVVDTCTFTNDLGRNYTKNAAVSTPVVNPSNSENQPVTPSTFKTPLPVGNFFFDSAYTVFPYKKTSVGSWQNRYTQQITDSNNQSLFNNEYMISGNGSVENTTGQNIGCTLNLETGQIYTVTYTYYWLSNTGTITSETVTATYTFLVVENELPLKKWTITDVINRLCDIAEPLTWIDNPRFQLNEAQAALFDNILAPQFSFTKSTFRECLQQCGKIVHGEPRLDIILDGGYKYEISFDLYGQTEQSGIYVKPYITKTVSQVVDSYASQIDSNAENLVNQLDKYAGVIVEPYSGGYKTVRTETLYVRITDENMIIPTQYPIYTIDKLECGFIPGITNSPQNIDITAYVFESSIYNSQLSSYSDQYPFSKAYGLCYTQGQKNITGLNFKVENAVSSVFENYAIINILEKVTNQSVASLTKNINYPILAFRITYTPFYNSRIGQTKVNYGDYPYAASLIYNQQANVIESRYYGENLKGAIARIGNVEKSITYNLARLSDVPSAGQMFDNDYYISAVSVEFLPTYIKCTIGLSKDFNRLSQYIGISSVKRFSEVSQTQALERNTLWKEYIVVGNQISIYDNKASHLVQFDSNFMDAVMSTFTQTGSYTPLTNVVAWGETYQWDTIPGVAQLPVVSSAFGNSIAFSWAYEDNYSAGAISQYETVGGVSGYFQNNYQYTDYYGKMYYYGFDLQEAGEQITSSSQTQIGTSLPEGEEPVFPGGFLSTLPSSSYILRKDNREKLQCNVQIDFVANNPSLIIGSALAAYCPLVRGTNSQYAAKLYVFDAPLNKFINHVEGSLNVNFENLTGVNITISKIDIHTYTLSAPNFISSGKSWAICTQQYSETIDVEDEEGNQTTQTIQYGGDVLLAQNMDITEDQAFTPIYFTIQGDIFNRDCWVANK